MHCRRTVPIAIAFLAAVVSAQSLTAADVPNTSEMVWDLGKLDPGKQYPTSITATNISCRGKHDFRLEIVNTPWLRLSGPNTLKRIPTGQSKSVDAIVNTSALGAGSYHGHIAIVCTDCPPPPACTQNAVGIDVRMNMGDPPGSIKPSIQFVEEEIVVLSGAVAKDLGYRNLKVLPGSYVVDFDDRRPFGYVLLDVEGEREPQAMAPNPGGFGPRIRIASRKHDCLSGIGFLCGLVPVPPQDGFVTYAANMHVVDGSKLEIVLTELVPWKSLLDTPTPTPTH